MPTSPATNALQRIADDSICSSIYDELLRQARLIGDPQIVVRATAVSLKAGPRLRVFMYAHPRIGGLKIAVITDLRILSDRIESQRKIGEHRWSSALTLSSTGEIDHQLLEWIEHAYAVAVS